MDQSILFAAQILDYLTAFGFPRMFYLKYKEKSSVCKAILDYLTAFGEPVLDL